MTNKFLLVVFLIALANTGYGQSKADTIRYLVPGFYTPVSLMSRDTVFQFACYDKRDSLIPKVTDFGLVQYFSLFKNYTDSTHTYKDANGIKQFLPVSVITKRYDRIGKDKWMCISYPGNQYTELKEYKNEVVRTDTIHTGSQVAIYQYYKVEILKQ